MNVLKNFSGLDLDFLRESLQDNVVLIENMTRNYYFRAVKYALAGIDKSVLNMGVGVREKMQRHMWVKAQRYNLNAMLFMSDDVLAYNKYTCGWVGDAIDNFGTIKNPDCPIEFKKWFDKYAYNGGHPFEIYPYVCLYVRRKDDGFHLELANIKIYDTGPSDKVLKMFIALRRAGICVTLRDRNLFLEQWQNYNLKSR